MFSFPNKNRMSNIEIGRWNTVLLFALCGALISIDLNYKKVLNEFDNLELHTDDLSTLKHTEYLCDNFI